MASPVALPTSAQAVSILSKINLPGKIAVGASVCVLIGFAYWFLFHAGLTSKIQAAQRHQLELKSKLTAAQLAQTSYIADREDLALRQQRSREFNKVLPTDKQQASFLSALQLALNAAGVDLKSFAPAEELKQPFYVKDPMRLEIVGRYHQVVKFIHEVGRLDRIINIENIELSDPRMVGDEMVLRGRCLATAFHALPSVSPAGAPQK